MNERVLINNPTHYKQPHTRCQCDNGLKFPKAVKSNVLGISTYMSSYMSRIMRNTDVCICKKKSRRSAVQ